MKIVKGDRDANIMFTPCNGCQGYRVLLGGWANQKSFIRDNEHDDRDQTLVEASLLFCFFLPYIMYTI